MILTSIRTPKGRPTSKSCHFLSYGFVWWKEKNTDDKHQISVLSLQLASEDEGGNMRVLPLSADIPALVEDSQAVLEDYTDAVEYRRAPLNPDLHQAEPDDKSSTYTLTNVVPLITDFLDSSWNPYLETIRRRLNNFCHGKSFIVTGVTLPGISIRRNNRDRMTAPKHLWLAYCCPRFDRNSPYEVRFMFPSYGGYALNEHVGFNVVEVPLKTLESFLRNQADILKEMTVFYKGCLSENTFKKKRRDLTVTQPQPEERRTPNFWTWRQC